MTERHSHQMQVLKDDAGGDTGHPGGILWRPGSGGFQSNGDLLTRSIERPAVRAGTECPRCSGSMFFEDQMHDEPELVCQSCSYNEVPVALPALLELAGELAGEIVPKKGNRANHRRAPASNGVNL